MKIKDSEVKKVFEPVTLEITFESLMELKIFWGMTNAPDKEVENNMSEYGPCDHQDISSLIYQLFDWVSEQLTKYD